VGENDKAVRRVVAVQKKREEGEAARRNTVVVCKGGWKRDQTGHYAVAVVQALDNNQCRAILTEATFAKRT